MKNKKTSKKQQLFETMDTLQKIVKTEYSDEMKQSFLDYSMSVIVARAIPDIRDGLKPVHRRIIYSMKELGLSSDKQYRKSANVVGTVLSKYHPHGDASVYDAMVNLTHNFYLTMPLIDGHGNFGSIEGDPNAAYRYTEARLEKYTEDVFLKDLSKQTVNFVPNFDNSTVEPEILPALLPNVLINGTNGIAVGMITSTPPHNLKEVVDAYKLYIKNPKIKIENIIDVFHGPDFPTGGIVLNKSELIEIYKNGTGKIKLCGKVEIERATGRGDRDKIVITEVPYTMIGSGIGKFLTDVAELAKQKVLPEISDISNQTSSEGIRLVIELKPNSDIKRVQNILYKKTKLEDTFPVNMLYIVNKRPETLGILDIFSRFHEFQVETKTNKYKAILQKQKEIFEIREGLILAIDAIDTIIEVLRGSKTVKNAKDCLMGKGISNIIFKTKKSEAIARKFSFTELQAQAILDMKLSRLINLELNALIKEKDDAQKIINKCEKILASKKEIDKIIVSELNEIEEKYSTKRKTKLTDNVIPDVDINKIPVSDVYIAYDKFGYFKCYDIATYERNKETFLETNTVLQTKNTSSIFVFTNVGNVHQIKISDISYCKAKDRGVPVDNLSGYNSANEHVVSVFSTETLKENNIVIVTKENLIKTVSGNEYITSRKLIQSTKLDKNDKIISVNLSNFDYICVLSSSNYILKMKIKEIPEQKRNSSGVRCMRLKVGEYITNAFFVKENDKAITINQKQFQISKIKSARRATQGQYLKI